MHLVGKLGSNTVTLELAAPRKEKAVRLHAASWQASGCPPIPCKYQIECSTDGEKTWQPVVKDWMVQRRDPEPGDFWSQSLCWGDAPLPDCEGPVRVRFRNDGGRSYLKVEAHLVYRVQNQGATEVTFGWKEGGALKTASHTFPPAPGQEDTSWTITAGQAVEIQWVQYEAK